MAASGISYAKAMDALTNGGLILAAQGVPINGLNGVSVVCCEYNCLPQKAIRMIYQGEIYQKSPSFLHFKKGLGPYFTKESSRLVAKVGGLTFLKPMVEQQHGMLIASLVFSTVLAAWEMVIQPFDTRCTWDQTGKKWTGIKDAYVGAAANGARQFKTWLMFSYMEDLCNRLLAKNSIDPSSQYGVAAKALPVGFSVTILSHPEQRLKNQLQCFKEIAAGAKAQKRSRYIAAWNHIIDTQGYWGLSRGFLAKGVSNSILAWGAIYLLARGRKQAAKKD